MTIYYWIMEEREAGDRRPERKEKQETRVERREEGRGK